MQNTYYTVMFATIYSVSYVAKASCRSALKKKFII